MLIKFKVITEHIFENKQQRKSSSTSNTTTNLPKELFGQLKVVPADPRVNSVILIHPHSINKLKAFEFPRPSSPIQQNYH